MMHYGVLSWMFSLEKIDFNRKWNKLSNFLDVKVDVYK